MLRLFLSLYALICIGLIVINYSSTWLFAAIEDSVRDEKFSDIQAVTRLAKGYRKLIQEGAVSVGELSTILEIDVTYSKKEHIAFLPEQLDRLNQGEVVNLFSSNDSLLLYFGLDSERLIQIGPIAMSSEHTNGYQQWLILASYITLAVFILGWSWPLWRDLRKLTDMTKHFSGGEHIPNNTVSDSSVLSPLAKSFVDMAERISELLQLQKLMLHAVSHDIRTPLARMKFALAMLNDSDGRENSSKSSLNEVKESLLADVEDVDQLVDNLLSFSKLETANIELDIQSVNLSELITNLIEKLEPLSDKTFSLQIEPDIELMCDGHLMERAIQNLLVNAQKFAEHKIDINVQPREDCVQIQINDDGIGIPHDQVVNVLKPFSRIESSRNKQSGGFGLGLAIVNKIVSWHYGQIAIGKSEYGGASITLNLPRKLMR
jgi:two-component system OmpR family sensor kinase